MRVYFSKAPAELRLRRYHRDIAFCVGSGCGGKRRRRRCRAGPASRHGSVADAGVGASVGNVGAGGRCLCWRRFRRRCPVRGVSVAALAVQAGGGSNRRRFLTGGDDSRATAATDVAAGRSVQNGATPRPSADRQSSEGRCCRLFRNSAVPIQAALGATVITSDAGRWHDRRCAPPRLRANSWRPSAEFACIWPRPPRTIQSICRSRSAATDSIRLGFHEVRLLRLDPKADYSDSHLKKRALLGRACYL